MNLSYLTVHCLQTHTVSNQSLCVGWCNEVKTVVHYFLSWWAPHSSAATAGGEGVEAPWGEYQTHSAIFLLCVCVTAYLTPTYNVISEIIIMHFLLTQQVSHKLFFSFLLFYSKKSNNLFSGTGKRRERSTPSHPHPVPSNLKPDPCC